MKKQKLTLKRIKHLAGFTLVEVLIVSVIVALIASITVPSLVGYISKARLDSEISDAERALAAVETELTELYNTSDDGEINCVYEGLDVSSTNLRVTQAIEEKNPYYNQLFYGVQEITGIDSLYTFVVGLGDYSTYSKDDIDKAYTPYIAYYQATASSTMLYYDGSSWEEAEDKTIGNEIVSLADGTQIKIQLYDIYFETKGPTGYEPPTTTTTKITTVTTTTTTTVAATEDEDEEEPTTEAVTDNGLAKAQEAYEIVNGLLHELIIKHYNEPVKSLKGYSIFGNEGLYLLGKAEGTVYSGYGLAVCSESNDEEWKKFLEDFNTAWTNKGYKEPYIMVMGLGLYNQYLNSSHQYSWDLPYTAYIFCFKDTESSTAWYYTKARSTYAYNGWSNNYPWVEKNGFCYSNARGGTFYTSDTPTETGVQMRGLTRYVIFNNTGMDPYYIKADGTEDFNQSFWAILRDADTSS